MPNFLQPNCQSRPQKESTESEQFWELLGGKLEYPTQKIARNNESDTHLFSCTFSKGLYQLILFHHYCSFFRLFTSLTLFITLFIMVASCRKFEGILFLSRSCNVFEERIS